MTARQIIQEIDTLPAAEQREVFISLQERFEAGNTPVRHLDAQTADPLIKEILADHADLFRKLAQ